MCVCIFLCGCPLLHTHLCTHQRTHTHTGHDLSPFSLALPPFRSTNSMAKHQSNVANTHTHTQTATQYTFLMSASERALKQCDRILATVAIKLQSNTHASTRDMPAIFTHTLLICARNDAYSSTTQILAGLTKTACSRRRACQRPHTQTIVFLQILLVLLLLLLLLRLHTATYSVPRYKSRRARLSAEFAIFLSVFPRRQRRRVSRQRHDEPIGNVCRRCSRQLHAFLQKVWPLSLVI